MSETPRPGWYPDSLVERQVRYWDGDAWTERVRPAVERHYGSSTVTYGGAYDDPWATPDGQPLAGWWRRVGASFIDFLVLVPVSVVVAWPFWSDIVDAYVGFFEDTVDASRAGEPTPSQLDLQSQILGDLVAATLIGIALSLTYAVVFLSWKQGTPGKLALGMRVRLRERPGPMPLGTILLRWGAQSGPSLLGVVPFVGYIANIYVMLDSLWPLWDGKKQALHDKAARTNVVMHVRS